MNHTTIYVSGLAIAVFAAAIAVRATQQPAGNPAGWLHLPPTEPALVVEPEGPPRLEALQQEQQRELRRTYERAVQKDARAKQVVDEALTDMRHARRKRAAAARDDELARTHWESSCRSASLRYESATHERRQALLSIDGVRRALAAQTGGSPSRVSLDSSK